MEEEKEGGREKVDERTLRPEAASATPGSSGGFELVKQSPGNTTLQMHLNCASKYTSLGGETQFFTLPRDIKFQSSRLPFE